ncbi:3-hydroxybutyryl-CoA dehydrogenase [Patulibacter medicamentivorans]|uniref:3-hydroxybutyryl-CoA dehydrogenase n=1 Tax=Patulibacter medicamentivorans TaxID=1097667 RepID=H0E2V6_9ACTN|nr:3-hydroxybutyryl-CoA dehydrogenase [Patulibacter medicamentivorans]EHN11973.1 3-hydroxybutyryl-CoA dehydrogenase [Patulibacter medicamentivorans]
MSTHPNRIGVVGGGQMGTGIAEVAARNGCDVVIVEVDDARAQAARTRIESSIARGVKRGKVSEEDAAAALGRLRASATFEDLADRQLVVEAVVERKDAKIEVIQRLGEIVEDPEAILASNTSSIPIVELGAAVGDRSGHVLGLHFFNPVPVLSLVEVVPSLLTDEAVVDRTWAFAVDVLKKDPIRAPDRAGFTVNTLLIPYLLSAIRMLEQGLASAKDIDEGMVKGCAHPMGPLALADLIGLDTVVGIAETLYAEQREQLFAPPALLQRLVAAGRLGRKTGHGLYDYQ